MNDSSAHDGQTPSTGTVLGGRFRIVRRIGEGGMGVVLEAENTLTGKRVAIKWMHPQMAAQADAAERMVREARASARVRHPNVVDVYDVVQEGGAIFLVMELLEGEPLTALMERGSAQPHALISHVIDAMRGVAAAHREGVIHRDIKPDNIFLARESDRAIAIPKVLDFGISKLTDREGGLSLTRTGMTLGTPMYMSYEQLAGVRDIDGRTDVYAFGVILYEALTGQSPFNAETFSELIIKITTTLPPTPKSLRPSLPSALSSIVETAMRKERAERTPTLDALISQLEPFSTADGYHSRVTALADAPIAWGPTVAAPTPVSLPISVPAPQPRADSRPALTTGRAAVTSVSLDRALDTFSDPPSIPRSFTARSALVWGGLALVIAAGAVWLATRSVEPSTAEPSAAVPELHVASPAEAVVAPPAQQAQQAPSAAPAAPKPEPFKPAPAVAPKPTPSVPVARETAQQKPTTKPRERATASSAVKPEPSPLKPTAPAQDTRPKPSTPGPRAGRPQSTEF